MTKQEFLEKLRLALSGRVNSEVVTENINFYEDYINTEIRKGKLEENVLEELGDPRLIARTIADTTPQSAGAKGGFADESQDSTGDGQRGTASRFMVSRLPAWAWLVLIVVVAVLVISAVFSVLSMILPFLLPFLLVLFFVKLFRDWIQ